LKEKKSKSKFLSKPKAKIQGISPVKVVNSFQNVPLVREGRTGYFSDEYEKELKFLR